MRKKGEKERVLTKGRKGGGRILIQTESVYKNTRKIQESSELLVYKKGRQPKCNFHGAQKRGLQS